MTGARAKSMRVRPGRVPRLVADPPPPPAPLSRVPRLQQAWWAVGILASLVGVLGFQASSPSRRLGGLERMVARSDSVNLRQDSVFAAHARAERLLLDSIQRQLGQLLAGQCVKERDRMARVVYGCGGG